MMTTSQLTHQIIRRRVHIGGQDVGFFIFFIFSSVEYLLLSSDSSMLSTSSLSSSSLSSFSSSSHEDMSTENDSIEDQEQSFLQLTIEVQ